MRESQREGSVVVLLGCVGSLSCVTIGKNGGGQSGYRPFFSNLVGDKAHNRSMRLKTESCHSNCYTLVDRNMEKVLFRL